VLTASEREAIARLWSEKLSQDARGLPQSERHRNLEPPSAEFICALAEGSRAQRLLEVGGSSGLSTIALAAAARQTGGRLVFLEDYEINLARYLVQGVDVWMNTPRRPYEASGTSGMKAALNGALNFSVLDGWWREAYNGHNGWSIGEDKEMESQSLQDAQDAESLYSTLENEIIPLYYRRDPKEISLEWMGRVKDSLKTNIPRFSTRHMVKEYVERLYVKALK